ncbi:MAG: L-histidine N(alpha)-methyltransferase [Leptothrix sp. (in: b-proteobacteria)]
MRTPRFMQYHQVDSAALASEAAAGLLAVQASASPKFFYDELGSRLFDAITALDEYYPTRTEAAILREQGDAIAAAVQAHFAPRGGLSALVDLGAGNCAKAASLFGALRPRRYLPLDISVDFLRHAVSRLQRQHADIEMVGIGLDFSARLALPDELSTELIDGPALLFYPGSSIGNFVPADALRLLREARELSQGGALLIGVDLVKDAATLEAAYDDALGVTAAFNLNLLRHLNQLIGSDFAPRDWRHAARFNAVDSRIEMHLHARRALTVRWPGGQRAFGADEAIHTENSYKWQPVDFEALLQDAGFGRVTRWTDTRGAFAVMLAEAG